MFTVAHLRENTFLLNLFVEAPEQTFKALIITGIHVGQLASHPFFR
jgi:hypothetical protein